MNRQLLESLGRGRGATATETIMMMILVALVIMAGIKLFQGGITSKVDFANDTVGAVSTEDQEMDRLRERGRKAKESERKKGGAQAASTATAQPEGGGKKGATVAGSGGFKARPAGPNVAAQPGAEAPAGGCGGFNPFLIPIALGMVGLLGYVMMKSQKG